VLLLARLRPVRERGTQLPRKRVRDPKRSRQLTPAPVLVLFPRALTCHLPLLPREVQHQPTSGHPLVLKQPEFPG